MFFLSVFVVVVVCLVLVCFFLFCFVLRLTSPKPQTYLYRQGPMQKEQMIHWPSSSSDVH